MSGSAFGFWLGVEIGTVSFLVLCNSSTAVENEGSCKYYIVQGFSSVFLFVSLMVSTYAEAEPEGEACTSVFSFFMILMMWVKVGLFPFHFWVVPVLGRVGWGSWFWIAVVQKTSSFWVISSMSCEVGLIALSGFSMVLTSLVGSLGGLGQMKIRAMMGYSSLVQSGWMGLLCLCKGLNLVIYSLIYGVIAWGLLVWMSQVNMMYTSCVHSLDGDLPNFWVYWMVPCSYFLSLAGSPPFMGFGLKLLALVSLLTYFWGFIVILLIASGVSLYFYLSVFINGMVGLSSNKFKFGKSFMFTKSGLLSALLCLNFFGGFPLMWGVVCYGGFG
uniref:NADH-ubiquinone oxidoreductase chain 2 n=1 Tax=Macoma balthica TaxID=1903275 RepID=A0A6H2U3D4_MACBL|nr:NADH dehydrogenase subunit 2 [Macoma balthica]